MMQTATVKLANEICKLIGAASYGIKCCPVDYRILRNIKFLERCSTIDVRLIKEKYGLQ